MSALEKAIEQTVNDQNEISDFIGAVPKETGVAEPKTKPEAVAPVFTKRGRGRPKGSKKPPKRAAGKSFVPDDLKSSTFEENAAGDQAPELSGENIQRNNAAIGATMLIQTSGMLIAGEDGKMSNDEFLNIRENFDRYFETKGITDFPPGIALGLSLGGYYVRALTTEKSLPRVVLFWSWLKSKFSMIRRKKTEQSKQENSENVA